MLHYFYYLVRFDSIVRKKSFSRKKKVPLTRGCIHRSIYNSENQFYAPEAYRMHFTYRSWFFKLSRFLGPTLSYGPCYGFAASPPPPTRPIKGTVA
jgi:hypothetical protein